ncbi:MAG TPA: zf-HC2 domain-containing protein [Blastocatellia bacterium]|nr:zf-HC2 domain-containing protein [Blastocatellia bacterium]
MQTMDCRNFKEVLDSYLSDELAVETNHAVLRHAEHCADCRDEMAARRRLRGVLRKAVQATKATPEFHNRLRERLRNEAVAEVRAAERTSHASFFSQWFGWFSLPQFAVAACLVLIVGGVFWLSNFNRVQAAEISPALWQQAAGDHDHCAAFWRNLTQGENDPVHKAETFDASLQDLGKHSPHKALGLHFHYAHVCHQDGRAFVHLIYSRDGNLISLLVTDRNTQAMKTGVVPSDDGLQAGLQHELSLLGKYSISAYQTSKHVVLLVSSLDEQTQQNLTEKLAQPISNLLRQRGK